MKSLLSILLLPVRRILALLALLALGATLASLSFAADTASLAGTWKIDPDRSTELNPWQDLQLTIRVDGDRVAICRHFSAGRRTFDEDIALDVAAPVNVVPVSWWPDNRHLGAYIGGDKTKRIRATWLDDRRILRLSADLVVSTQQGERAINILSDYKVTANGAQLTLTEQRSTRNRPVVYTFKRVASSP